MKKLLVFDMDGTMFDTEAVYARSYQEALKEVGVDFSFNEYAKNFAGQTEQANQDELVKKLGDPLLAEDVYHRAESLREDIYENEGVQRKPGLQALLDYLNESGIQAMVASSSDRETILYLLRQQNLEDVFVGIVAGDEIEHSKPHPEIFLTAAENSGLDKEDILIVEDSLAGVEAGYRSGMEVVMVPDMVEADDKAKEQATYIVSSLEDIIPLLKSE